MTNVVSLSNALREKNKKSAEFTILREAIPSNYTRPVRTTYASAVQSQGHVRKDHYNYLDTLNADNRAQWVQRYFGGAWYPDTMTASQRAEHTRVFEEKLQAARQFLRGVYGR